MATSDEADKLTSRHYAEFIRKGQETAFRLRQRQKLPTVEGMEKDRLRQEMQEAFREARQQQEQVQVSADEPHGP